MGQIDAQIYEQNPHHFLLAFSRQKRCPWRVEMAWPNERHLHDQVERRFVDDSAARFAAAMPEGSGLGWKFEG